MLFSFCLSVFLCCGLIFFSLTHECRRTVRLNCRRLNGSWSRRRFRREAQALKEYVTSVAAPLLLAFLATFAAASYVFTYVMPYGLIADSFEAFDTDSATWEANMGEVRKQHAAFASGNGLSTAEVDQLQKSLWQDWPAIAVSTIALLAIAYLVVFKTAGHAVSTWASGIRQRRTTYARGDVAGMQNGAFAKDPKAPAS